MSDILIKGMEMPTSCTECPCCRHDNWNGETAHQCNVSLITFSAEDENWIYDQRPNWCPLVEISTPHGRLIAEKTIMEIRYHDADGYHIVNGEQLCELEIDAETVIEAEGSET